MKENASELEVLTLDSIITGESILIIQVLALVLYKERYDEAVNGEMTLKEPPPLLKSIRIYNIPGGVVLYG